MRFDERLRLAAPQAELGSPTVAVAEAAGRLAVRLLPVAGEGK